MFPVVNEIMNSWFTDGQPDGENSVNKWFITHAESCVDKKVSSENDAALSFSLLRHTFLFVRLFFSSEELRYSSRKSSQLVPGGDYCERNDPLEEGGEEKRRKTTVHVSGVKSMISFSRVGCLRGVNVSNCSWERKKSTKKAMTFQSSCVVMMLMSRWKGTSGDGEKSIDIREKYTHENILTCKSMWADEMASTVTNWNISICSTMETVIDSVALLQRVQRILRARSLWRQSRGEMKKK